VPFHQLKVPSQPTSSVASTSADLPFKLQRVRTIAAKGDGLICITLKVTPSRIQISNASVSHYTEC
jgi:hypothetical protein